MRTINLDSLHCFCEIVDGRFEEGDSIVVEYYLHCSSEWRALAGMESGPDESARKQENVITKQSSDQTGGSARRSDDSKVAESSSGKRTGEVPRSVEVHGCTRKSVRDANNRCTFNQLFELNFEFERPVAQEIQLKSSPNGPRPDGRTALGDQTNRGDRVDSRDPHDQRDQNDSRRSDDGRADVDRGDKDGRSGERDAKNGRSGNAKKATDPQLMEWPYFELRVWSVDQWKRKTFVGLALLGLPQKPGQYTENVDIWSLTSNQPKAKLMQHFLGYSFEPKSWLTDQNDWRISLNGASRMTASVVGRLRIKLNLVVCRHVPTHLESEEFDAIEEKIQRVVVAFRDARKRMQFLLRNKENIRFNRFEREAR